MFLKREKEETTLSKLRNNVSLSSASIVLTEWEKPDVLDIGLEMHLSEEKNPKI